MDAEPKAWNSVRGVKMDFIGNESRVVGSMRHDGSLESNVRIKFPKTKKKKQ